MPEYSVIAILSGPFSGFTFPKRKRKNKTDFTVQKKPMFFGVSHSETIWKNSENPNWSTFFRSTKLCKSQSVSRSLSDKSGNEMPDLILST
jgi:hypothetical protein